MAKLLKLRRGTTTQHGSFTGAEGEVTVDTDKETLVVHDGSTAGGHPVAAEDMANVSSASIAGRLANDSLATSKLAAGALPSDVTVASANLVDGTIVNADVNASAAIAGTKISPDFGSQEITTTGNIMASGGYVGVNGTGPQIRLNDTDSENDFEIQNDNGIFKIRDVDAGSDRVIINSAGTTTFAGNSNFSDGIDVTGATRALSSLTVGSGNDFQVTRSSGNTEVQNYSGTLLIGNASSNSNNIFFRARADENSIECVPDGAVKLYHDGGGVKFATSSTGATLTGNLAVTGTVDGRDVATDGTKLDGIEASATADQTAAEIRTLVESASDSNVFTDADHTKLNGIESGATADQTASEIASLLDGQNLHTTGEIGRDAGDYIKFSNNTHADIYINSNNEFRFEADGDFHADGDVIAQSTTISSDRKLKENIEVIPNALDKVLALNGVSFDWKKTGEKSAGVIAQEVQGVLPEAVKEVTALSNGESHLSVNYHALTSILIEAIKELQAEVEKLKGGK